MARFFWRTLVFAFFVRPQYPWQQCLAASSHCWAVICYIEHWRFRSWRLSLERPYIAGPHLFGPYCLVFRTSFVWRKQTLTHSIVVVLVVFAGASLCGITYVCRRGMVATMPTITTVLAVLVRLTRPFVTTLLLALSITRVPISVPNKVRYIHDLLASWSFVEVI